MVQPDILPSPENDMPATTRFFTSRGFELESGAKLPEMKLAFATYGTLAPGGTNAMLLTHGFTSNHHAAGRWGANDENLGWWDNLVGSGKTIDTDRFFCVSSNMLGSSYGSTSPATINPATGKPYGLDFPEITLGDIVRAQKLMLDDLGVRHLHAVAGPSFGGYQAFEWAVTFPTFMDRIVAVVTAPTGRRAGDPVKAMLDRFAADPNWNGGQHYERGGIGRTMTELRIETLKGYGAWEAQAAAFPDPVAREARLRAMAEAWAKEFDPNSMITLRKATLTFDAARDFAKIRARVLYVLSRTDKLFPPSLAPDVMAKLGAAGVNARYVDLDSDFGHLAPNPDWKKWAPALAEFLA
jgi:homoserine O-acetyltransferase